MPRQFSFSMSLVLFTLILTLTNTPSWGWIGTGHKIVALVAWDDLTPKTKAAITELLKKHPQYEKVLMENAPEDETPAEKDRTAFATAATWPDEVRKKENPMNTLYNHPDWHFLDIPFVIDNQPVVEKPPKGPPPHDAAAAYVLNVKVLKDAAKSESDKAIALSWVEHIVGDVHQPLHSTSLFSPDYPEGDQGGNGEAILKDPPYPDSLIKLHLLWDELPGDFQSEELDRYEAQGLRADPKYSREAMKDLLKDTDFMGWVHESHEIAVHQAYLDGKLKTGPAPFFKGVYKGKPTTEPTNEPAAEPAPKTGRHTGRTTNRPTTEPTVPGVPPGYMKTAEHIAMKQVVLAGYRLADVLNGIYDPK